MKSIKYGLMHKETQEFMGVYNTGEYSRGTYSLNASTRFEEDSVRHVVEFFNADKTRDSYSHWATSGHDPDDFIAVAFVRTENGFNKSEDVKQITLPDVVKCKMEQARRLKETPKKLRDRYFSAEVQEAIQGRDTEAYVVIPEGGRQLKEGDFIYISQLENVIGEVKMISEVPDGWPITSTDHERDGWQFVLIERGTKALEAKAVLSDIEPIAPTPGM
jgi:hypothetical protein